MVNLLEMHGPRIIVWCLLRCMTRSPLFRCSFVMADREKVPEGTPRCFSPPSSASSDGKRRERPPHVKIAKKRKDDPVACSAHSRGTAEAAGPTEEVAVAPPVAGPSHVPDPSASSAMADKYDKLSALVGGLIDRLEKGSDTDVSRHDFSGFRNLSSSEDEEGEIRQLAPDCLDELDQFSHAQHNPNATEADSDFLQALEELSGHFHGEEEKGEPLSERLAVILNTSLRRRPTSEGVKLTCGKIKLPSNVPNLTVPSTNSALTKAMSVGGRLIDARIAYTNGLLSKALVPIAQCISDIGDRKGGSINSYLHGLNNSLRLLTSSVNYLNHLRKEVARIHVHDSALVDICRWDCEVGTDELFPFDVVKKCDDIHKTKKLGRPFFRPFKSSGPRKFPQHRQAPRRSYTQQLPRQHYHQDRPRPQTKPFLGHKASQGRGTHRQPTYP